MSQDEACVELARECPRKILGALHRQGHYVHGTSSRFPGKVLCFHRDSPRPEDWTPTPAQSIVFRGHCEAPASGGRQPPVEETKTGG